MKILFWVIALPVLALIGAFAAANHGPVTLTLWPFPYEAELPIYGAVLGAFALGFFLAALWVWIAGIPTRLARRRLARHERKLEDEMVALREQLAEARAETARARHQGETGGETVEAARRNVIVHSD